MDCISIIKKASDAAGMKFQLGHLEEICTILASNTNANLTTYPCVMVLEDIREVEILCILKMDSREQVFNR